MNETTPDVRRQANGVRRDAILDRIAPARRRFICGALGAAATATVAPWSAPLAAGRRGRNDGSAGDGGDNGIDTFGRMFRLPPFAEPGTALAAALMEIGRPGGIMDARDPLSQGPVALIIDPALSVNNRDNPAHTAGVTFMGQFMDHDMTFDTSSRLGQPTSPERTANARIPTFDLDAVYGAGPIADAHLYDGNDGIKLRIESGGLFEDVPRAADMTALIADPRNDEHLILSGLHAAFIRFHNRAVDSVRARNPGAAPDEVFASARRLTTWHYQWLIVHEFLPLFIGPATYNDIAQRGRRYYVVREHDDAFMPIEFQGAAFRFGHSMVRPSYRANLAGDNGAPFFGLIFDPAQAGRRDPADLSGRARGRRRFVGWQTFFDFGDDNVRPNKRIDTRLSTPLFNLPRRAIAGPGGPTSLAQRNLLRQVTWRMPSGQSVARAIGAPPLARGDLDDLRTFGLGLDASTPLWFYVLREADVMADGRHLGPVGGRIVGEVIVGMLQADPDSYLSAQPNWRPTAPAAGGDPRTFRMTDFLRFAGVDPASRGQ